MLTARQLQQLQSAGGEAGGLSWFKWRDTNPDGRPSKAVEYDDFDQTYAAIKQGEGGCAWPAAAPAMMGTCPLGCHLLGWASQLQQTSFTRRVHYGSNTPAPDSLPASYDLCPAVRG
jgi:hypothetical protein